MTMKNALKRLHDDARSRWRLTQARTAIARCNRLLARRARIGVPVQRAIRPTYRFEPFAPGVIEGEPRRAPSWRAYARVVVIAVLAAAVLAVAVRVLA